MDEMHEGVRVHTRRGGTFDAEVVIERQVVWQRRGYRSYTEAQAEADRELARIKERR